MNSWLPITEYAVKNQVSVSTIRRKIKNQELKHKLEGGKYFILDATEATKKPKAQNDEVLDFAERSMKEIAKLNQELITEKDEIILNQKKKMQELQEELAELKMLVTLLERNKA